MTVPVELPVPGIGTAKVQKVRTEIGYSIQGHQLGRPQVYTGRGASLQVAGSQAMDQGKLTLTATLPEEMTVTPETQVTLRFEAFKPGLPERTAAGKVNDFLTIGAARLVLTALAPDFSEATLAVVSGSLEETLQQQLQLGSEMPAFLQMDLLNRKTLTREDLLERARNTPGIVFIFGDLLPSGGPPRFGPPSRGFGSTLPLPVTDVVEQAGVDLQPKPVVVLITRQISMGFLYDELRNRTPDYVVLADYANPLRTMFQPPQSTPGPYYGGPSYPGSGQEPSLRQLFNLPENMLSIAAFDPKGRIIYVKSETGSTFLPSLAQARAALKSAGKQDE